MAIMVTATGMASVAHQTTIRTTIAATDQPTGLRPDGTGEKSINTKELTRLQNPFLIYMHLNILPLMLKKGA